MKFSGKTLKLLRIAAELLLVAALVFVLVRSHSSDRPGSEDASVTVTWYLPSGETRQQTLDRGGQLTLPEGDVLDGYTFLGWRDSRGNMEQRPQFSVYEDCGYAAVYAVALETEKHISYLDIDSSSLFHPSEPLTRREAAVMLYRLMDTELQGTGSFTDVSPDDPCCAAAATLKTLGIVEGSRFHPDETITRGELLEMLAALYPASAHSYDFTDLSAGESYYSAFCTAVEQGWLDLDGQAADPDGSISRAETAVLMNRLLGREDAIGNARDMVGTILDVSFTDENFRDIAEASIVHEHEGEGADAHWTASKALPLREPGFFFVGQRLHCISEEGSPVMNDTIGLLTFNAAGEVSTGIPECDELLAQALRDVVGQPKYRDMTQLRALYNYTVEHFSYLRRNLYESGETGWEAEEAYTMLSTGKGNCYNFAAVFGQFARFLGFDAQIYSGTITGQAKRDDDGEVLDTKRTPHAWVEIEADDGWRIFDPESTYAYLGEGSNFFNRGEGTRRQFGYKVG